LGADQRQQGLAPLGGFFGVDVVGVCQRVQEGFVRCVHALHSTEAGGACAAYLRLFTHDLKHNMPKLKGIQHMVLDNVDLKILDELQRDGALSNVTLAKRIGLSPSPCLARVKALESHGVIQRYVALASAAALGLGLTVFISISLKTQSKETLADFEAHIARHDEVMECYLMTGDSDYLLRVAVRDMAALERFILEQLSPIPGVEKIRSSFALKQVRYKTALPLGLG
jgi:DNA-binding Lrp family transcriptional regulator